MITKERLEELIEQGATIYAITKNPFIVGCSQILEVEEFDLKAPIFKEISEDGKQFLYYDYLLDLEYLFETEEKAEFAVKYKRIPRTEYLDLPDWEEFNKNSYFQFVSKDMSNIVLADSSYLEIDEYIDGEFVQTYFHKEMNKENYIEACDLCRKLFLGEEI